MAAFEYKALDAKGRHKKGVIEGDNARQVRQRLKEQGLVPMEVVETQVKAARSRSQGFAFKRGISTPDLALITRQLATLVQSGMPLEECLRAVAEQSEKPRIRTMLVAVRAKVTEVTPSLIVLAIIRTCLMSCFVLWLRRAKSLATSIPFSNV